MKVQRKVLVQKAENEKERKTLQMQAGNVLTYFTNRGLVIYLNGECLWMTPSEEIAEEVWYYLMANKEEIIAALKARQPDKWGTMKSDSPPLIEERQSFLPTPPVERLKALIDVMRADVFTEAADQVGYYYGDQQFYITDENNLPPEVINMLAARVVLKDMFDDCSVSFESSLRLRICEKWHASKAYFIGDFDLTNNSPGSQSSASQSF